MQLQISKTKVRIIYLFVLSLYLTLSLLSYPFMGRCSSTITINSDMQYSYALERFNQHDFQTAIVELNRFIYFFPDDQRIKDAIFKKGLSLFHTKRYGEAITVFRDLSAPLFGDFVNDDSASGYLSGDSANAGSASDYINGDLINDYSLNIEAVFMLSTTFLAIKRDASAEMVLQDFLLLNDERDTPAREDKALYALVWIYLARARESKTPPGEASQSLVKAVEYIDKMTPSGREQYKTDYLKKEIVKIIKTTGQEKKNSVIAGVASIIPGGGFAYCNRYQDALVSFLLNSAFVLASVESFEDGNGYLGGLIGFVGFGFYGGSIYGGISSAHKHNKSVIRNGVDSIKNNVKINSDISPVSYDQLPVIDDNEKKKNGHRIPLLSIQIPF